MNLIAAMDSRIALEIGGQRFRGNVTDAIAGAQCLIKLEFLSVRREEEKASGNQYLSASVDQCRVVAPDVERALHALGVGEGGRVEEDQVVALAAACRLSQPFAAVGLHQRVVP